MRSSRPVLIATRADASPVLAMTASADRLMTRILSNLDTLPTVIDAVLEFADAPSIDISTWEGGRYCPTPTIIEAAIALYGGHKVEDISKKDAGAENLRTARRGRSTCNRSCSAKERSSKAIYFVTTAFPVLA